MNLLYVINIITVNFAYNEPGYNVHPDITNTFQIPDPCPSLFYSKNYGYNVPGYSVHSDIRNTFFCPEVSNYV